MNEFVKKRVHELYWEKDLNCASTTLLVLSEYFDISIGGQVLDSAIGMHGAGGYQAQCGLVEGTLMFIGILGRANLIPDEKSISFCKEVAKEFESEFSSLECKILRIEGFSSENPPHLCESLTYDAITRNIKLISNWLAKRQ